MKKYKIDFVFPLEKVFTPKEPIYPGGPPSGFEYISMLPEEKIVNCNGKKIFIGESLKLKSEHDTFDYSQITIIIQGENFEDVLIESKEVINPLIDFISIQIQKPIIIQEVNITDVSGDIEIDQERESINITDPKSLIQPYQYSSIQLPRHNILRPNLDTFSITNYNGMKVTLWWYLKALNALTLLDQLSSIFIVLEKISGPHKTGAYKAPCNHMIEQCPICSAKTTRTLKGDTIKEYLVINGFSIEESRKLWEIRQTVHGKDIFTYESMFDNSILINRLIVLMQTQIQNKLGIDGTRFKIPPFTIGPSIKLAGIRKLTNFDLNIIKMFEETH